jgi:isoleucyl-tRNA synthetase
VPLTLKDTLNLPKTDFSMKANLPNNEPKLLAHWDELALYKKIREERNGSPIYVLHDGPPYANGPIHLGHALNKCLKDFIVKSKTMQGFDAPYVPGWDCHGLPIEIKVDDALGRKKLEMAPLEVRDECRKYAEKFVDLQSKQFQRIGVFGRFDKPYLTMSHEYESVVLEQFYAFFEQEMVYKGLKPVYWCINDRTALAEAEVEYEMHSSPSVWVKYRLTSDPAKIDPALAGKTVSTIIWTTTPWTLPASMAVGFNPDEEYVAIQAADGEIYVVAEKLAAQTAEKTALVAHSSPVVGLEWGNKNILARFPGRKLELAEFQHPFLDRKILGVVADYVTMDTGTGAVHTAPAHGADDFYTGVRYGIDQTCNVDAGGHLRNGLPEYEGQTVFKANPLIVELLKSRGVLLGFEKIEHSYPHCWRCHKPVIFRATEQWFIGMETKVPAMNGKPEGTLRARALEEIKTVKWDPAWGEERISNMIATRPDWCISRQRIWGVPIAVFFCEHCNEPLNSKEINRSVVDLFKREGADAWYKHEASQLLAAGTKCAKCGKSEFRKEMDIIDVWFESGSSQAAVLGHEPGLPWPADLYTEGGDQHRGWFHSSLLCAVGVRNQSPYRMVATSGWTLDPQGRAMSKSLGNVVDPVDIANRLGAEIVRLWVASVDFREDVRASEELIQRVADNYRKIRNTFRYILGNLSGFDPKRDAVPFAEMEPLDQYMLGQTAEMINECLAWYDKFEFHRIYQRVIQFCVVSLSQIYFDVLKDRLYTFAPRNKARLSAQTAIWKIGEALVRLLAPIMSFTADEVWKFLPAVEGRKPSAHLDRFPDTAQLAGEMDAQKKADWQQLLGLRNDVLKALEEARQNKVIGGNLEAEIKIAASEPAYSVLKRNENELKAFFIVSSVILDKSISGNESSGLNVQVSVAPGEKCERCWNYSTHVGEDPRYPTVCERCNAALKEIEQERAGTAGAAS